VITSTERREARLARRLWELGKPDVFSGVTKPGDVKKRIRSAILGANLGQSIGHIVAFQRDGVTLEQAFAATYNEPLIQEKAA
jgi:hypothetical protein